MPRYHIVQTRSGAIAKRLVLPCPPNMRDHGGAVRYFCVPAGWFITNYRGSPHFFQQEKSGELRVEWFEETFDADGKTERVKCGVIREIEEMLDHRIVVPKEGEE